MFEVSVDDNFAAAHNLRGYKGKCEDLHGHNYKVRLVVEGEELDPTGLLYDFVYLKQALKTITKRLDHKYLNELPPFDTVNPSAENIARYIHDETSRQLDFSANGPKIASVTVWETDTSVAVYKP